MTTPSATLFPLFRRAIVLGIAFLLTLECRGWAQGPGEEPDDDQTIIAEAATTRLTVKFPAEVKAVPFRLKVSDNELPAQRWSVTKDGVRYEATVVTLKEGTPEDEAAPVLNALHKSLAEELKGLLSKPRRVSIAFVDGQEKEIVGGVWKDARATARIRTFLIDRFALSLAVVQPGDRLSERAAKSFIESLQYIAVDRFPLEEDKPRP